MLLFYFLEDIHIFHNCMNDYFKTVMKWRYVDQAFMWKTALKTVLLQANRFYSGN